MPSFRTSLPLAGLAFVIAACDSPLPPRSASPEFARASGVATDPGHGNAGGDSKIRIGFAIAPVPLDLRGRTPPWSGSEATSSTRRRTARVATASRSTPRVGIRIWASRK